MAISNTQRAEAVEAGGALLTQIGVLRKRVEALKTTTNKDDYLNRLKRMSGSIFTMIQDMNTGRVTDAAYLQQMIRLQRTIPKELSVLSALISADEIDPTGKQSGEIITAGLERIKTEEELRMQSFAMDPTAWASRKAAAVGKGALDFQIGAMKSLWPVLLIGGGVIGLIYFGPALRKIATAGASRVGRKPGDPIPGTISQPEGA